MRRRDFIASLGAASTWPLVAPAQQREGLRRIGVLMAFVEHDREGASKASARSTGKRAAICASTGAGATATRS
jgi:putative tryptophan/tyrosine transport system substrate-binding protein